MLNHKSLFAIAAIAGLAGSANAAIFTYDATPGTPGAQDGAGSGWNTTGTNTAWWDGAGDVAWSGTTNTAVFGAGQAAAGTVTVGTVSASQIIFNANSGSAYTLNSGTITLGASGITANENATINSALTLGTSQSWTVASGKTLTLGGATTGSGVLKVLTGKVSVGTGGSINLSSGATNGGVVVGSGTMEIAGGTVTGALTATSATAYNFMGTGAASTLTMSSGSITLNATTSTYKNIILGQTKQATWTQTGGDATFNCGTVSIADNPGAPAGNAFTISGGTFTLASANAILNLGTRGSSSFTVSGSAVVTVPSFIFSNAGATGYTPTNTLSLNGGTLVTGKVSHGLGTSNLVFNGGTLKAYAASTSFMTGLSAAKVQNGGAVIDDGGYAITIGQALVEDSTSTGGGLTKKGTGTLTLSGANTYTGDTTVTNGTLLLTNKDALAGSTFAGGAGTLTLDSSVTGNAFNFGGLKGSTNLALQNNAANAVALTVGSNGISTTYSGILSAGGSLTKTGSGTLALSGSNSYSGGTTITAGTLEVRSGGVVNSSASSGNGGLVVNGGTLSITGGSVTGSYTGADGTGYNFISNTAASTLSMSGGSLTLNAANSTYKNIRLGAQQTVAWNQTGGDATFNCGSVTIADNPGVPAGSAFTVSGGTFKLASANATLNLGTRGSSTFTVGGSAVVTVPNFILGNAGATDYTPTNTLSLNGGALVAGKVGRGSGTANLIFNGGTLKASAASTSFLTGLTSAKVQNGGAVIDSNGYDITVSQALAADTGSTGGLTKKGAGVMTLSSANSYTGATVVEQGTLRLAPPTQLQSNLKIMPLGDSITYGGSNSGYRLPLANQLVSVAPGVQFVGDSTLNTGTMPAGMTNHSGHTSYSTRDMTNNLDGFDNATYLKFGGADRNPNGGYWLTGGNGTGRAAITPDAILVLAGANDINRRLTASNPTGDPLLADFQSNIHDLLTKLTDMRPDAWVFMAKASPYPNYAADLTTFNNCVVSEVASFQAAGKKVVLVDLNTGFDSANWLADTVHPNATGYTWMANQWYNALVSTFATTGGVNLLPDNAPLIVQTGATLDLAGNQETIGALSGAGAVTLGGTSGVLTLNNTSGQDSTFTGAISGAGALVKSGVGMLTLSGSNSYTGGTTVNAGTLKADNANAFGTGVITVTGGVLDLNNKAVTNVIHFTNGTGNTGVLVGAASANVTMNVASGAILNTTGQTIGGTTTVDVGGTLKGTGSLGALNVYGTLAPGNSPGITKAGDTTWESTGNYVWEVNDATGTAGNEGSGFDQLQITGGLTIQSGFKLNVTSLNPANASGTPANWNGGNTAYSWTIATTTGGITLNGIGNLNSILDFSGWTAATATGSSWTLAKSLDGNDLVLTYVPEPGALGLLAFGALALLGRRRNRR